MTFAQLCILLLKRRPELKRADILAMDRVWIWEVELSPDWEQDEQGRLAFLTARKEERPAQAEDPKERRRQKYRILGYAEHQIDEAIAAADAKLRDLYQRAGIGGKRG